METSSQAALLDEAGNSKLCQAWWRDSSDEPWQGGGAALKTSRLREEFLRGPLKHKMYRLTAYTKPPRYLEKKRERRKLRRMKMSEAEKSIERRARQERRRKRRLKWQKSLVQA